MAVNRVNFGGNTLIDLTGDTLESAEQLLKGIIAHARDGSQIVGALEAGGGGGSTDPYAKIITGTHTPAKNETSITFLPDVNFVLRYFILQVGIYSNNSLGSNIIKEMCVFRGYPQASRVAYAANGHWSMPNNTGSNQALLVFPGNSSTTLYLGAGVTYNWIAVYSDV